MATYETMGQRAWYAYQCLARNEMGKLPSYRALEAANGPLSNNTLRKLFADELTRPGPIVARNLAKALGVASDWLQFGEGAPPVNISGWPITARPARKAKAATTLSPSRRQILEGKKQKIADSVRPAARKRAGK